MAGADVTRRRRDGYKPLDAAHLGRHDQCIALIEEALAADNYLPSEPSFASGTTSFAVAALSRARGMLARTSQAMRSAANPWTDAQLPDERTLGRCIDRARAGGVPEKAVLAVEGEAVRTQKALEAAREANVEDAKAKAAAEKERCARGACDQLSEKGGVASGAPAEGAFAGSATDGGSRGATNKASTTSKASTAISFAERETKRRQAEKERADAVDAEMKARYAAIEEERVRQLYAEGRRARQPKSPKAKPAPGLFSA